VATSVNPIEIQVARAEGRISAVEAAQASINSRLDRIEGLLWALVVAIAAAIIPYFLGKIH
jgi:hypothetical protein